MPCTKPLKAYKCLNIYTKNHKNKITIIGKKLDDSKKYHEEFQPIELPCGQCAGCRVDRTRDWALRIIHEASLYPDCNSFLTLTFNDENMNSKKTLVKKTFQDFMKRLRRKFKGVYAVQDDSKVKYPIRFFHCGEYGDNFDRPHHHACVFNIDFDDKEFFKKSKNGDDLFTSEKLDQCWSIPITPEEYHNHKPENIWLDKKNKMHAYLGFAYIGEVTYDSAAYVASYCQKKVNGPKGVEHYIRYDPETDELYYIEPEFATMSTRPGIGKQWFTLYHQTDLYSKDFVTYEGKKFPAPVYYDKLLERVNPVSLETIKQRRLANAKLKEDDHTVLRLQDKERCINANLKKKERHYESGNVLSL